MSISEHDLKDDQIIQCILEGYAVVSHLCRKEHKGGGITIYSSKNTLQALGMNYRRVYTQKRTLEVTGIELTGTRKNNNH